METRSSEKILTFLAGCLVFSVPALALVTPHGASGPIVVLLMLALASLPLLKSGGRLQRAEKILLLIFFAYFAWVLLSWASTGFVDEGVKYTGRAARFALIIPVYLLLRRLRIQPDWLFYGVLTGAIGAGLWAVLDYAYHFDYSHGGRASGATHPILFGDLALVMGFVSLCFWSVYQAKWQRLLILAAFIMGLIASLLSASRGGWIALPVLSLFLLWQSWHRFRRYQKILIVFIMIVVPMVAYLVPQTGVQYRLQQAQQDIARFEKGDSLYNSLGERFAMWEAAWLIFQENPITGTGVGRFIEQAHQVRDAGLTPPFQDDHYHAHNEYITVAAQTGLIGLVMLLLIFVYPAYVFFSHLHDGSALKCSASLAGVVLIIGYMHFALSEAIFHRSLPVLFYAFFVAMLFIVLHQDGKNSVGVSL